MSWLQELLGDESEEESNNHSRPDLSARLAPGTVHLIFATQTGVAEFIAEDTLEQLEAVGTDVRMIEFEAMDMAVLEEAKQILFITSTTYDGDPPDMAEGFFDEYMQEPASLTHVQYGLLGLGDRSYDTFCGFGHTLDNWLQASGAQPWFDMIEVDDEDEQAIQCWHDCVDVLTGVAED